MKQEDVNTIVDRCINDFNFDCVLKFFGVFGDTESPKFWLNVRIVEGVQAISYNKKTYSKQL